MSQPRPQVQPLNGKRPSMQRGQDGQASQHDDLIKFICDSWNKVSREYEHCNQNGAEGSKGIPAVIYYTEQDSNPLLKDFQPFDLEAWWGKRVVESLNNSSQNNLSQNNTSHSPHLPHTSHPSHQSS